MYRNVCERRKVKKRKWGSKLDAGLGRGGRKVKKEEKRREKRGVRVMRQGEE